MPRCTWASRKPLAVAMTVAMPRWIASSNSAFLPGAMVMSACSRIMEASRDGERERRLSLRPQVPSRRAAWRSRQPEFADRVVQAEGLVLQAGRGGGAFLDERGVLLRHLVHVDDRGADLGDAGVLLRGRGRDLRDDVGGALHGRAD